jgi:hypothetical protein
MIELVPDTLTQLSITLGPFLNSNFITSLVGAGAGAWAGAYAAQKIAARAKFKEDLTKEISNATAAFNLTTMICNVCLSLKGQYINDIYNTYEQKKLEFLKFRDQRAAGTLPAGSVFELEANFQTVSPITTPVEDLKSIIFENISGNRRSVIFTSMLSQSLRLLTEAIGERNRLIEEYRTSGPHSQAELFHFYFAVRDPAGNIDNRYSGIVTAVYRYVDDCIFFSKSVADELSAHGKIVSALFNKNFNERIGSVGELKITKKEYQDIMPDRKEYASWDDV